VLRGLGVYPIIDNYYEPLFSPAHLRLDPRRRRDLPGLDLCLEKQVKLLGVLAYAGELVALKLDQPPTDELDFNIANGSFDSGDAEFLYQFIRHIKPRRVIEIGSGHSTKIARLALAANERETGISCEHTCIEPFEMPWLERLGVRVIRKKVEDCPLGLFEQLSVGDLLFVDSSHIIRPQGDVLHCYLSVVPRLSAGVNIHIHDIFTPADYTFLQPEAIANIRFWNEQYLVEAMLTHSTKFEVIAALNFLKNTRYHDLESVCPYLTPDREPGSFYIRVRA